MFMRYHTFHRRLREAQSLKQAHVNQHTGSREELPDSAAGGAGGLDGGAVGRRAGRPTGAHQKSGNTKEVTPTRWSRSRRDHAGDQDRVQREDSRHAADHRQDGKGEMPGARRRGARISWESMTDVRRWPGKGCPVARTRAPVVANHAAGGAGAGLFYTIHSSSASARLPGSRAPGRLGAPARPVAGAARWWNCWF